MDFTLLVEVLGVATVAGVLIGAMGVGGVIVVPVLTQCLAMPPVSAIAAAMFGYILSGAVGVAIFARRRTMAWGEIGVLACTAAPAAFCGAALTSLIRGSWLLALVSLGLLLSGAQQLLLRRMPTHDLRLSTRTLAMVGVSTGLGSALTGTSGPMILMPILMELRMPLMPLLGLSRAIQLPIASSATLANILMGTVDLWQGLAIGTGLCAGTALGAALVQRVSLRLLEPAVGIAMLAAGALLLVRSGRALL
jgi:uncharacterized membrane protein YfcA